MHSGQVTLIESGSRRCPNTSATNTFTTNNNGTTTTTMIVNLGARNDAASGQQNHNNHNHHNHHHTMSASAMQLLQHQHSDSITDELTMLAPISTVTSATGVLLASSTAHQNLYQSHQPTLHHDHQHQKHHIQQSNSSHHQQIHVLNGCDMIITTTSSQPNNNGATNHHLGNDIQLFEIPNNHCNVIHHNNNPSILNTTAANTASSTAAASSSTSSNPLATSPTSVDVDHQQQHQVYVTTSSMPSTTIQSNDAQLVPAALVVDESAADLTTDIDGVSVQELDGDDGLDGDDADLRLLDIADHSYSSQGSLEIDLEAHLDDNSRGGEWTPLLK